MNTQKRAVCTDIEQRTSYLHHLLQHEYVSFGTASEIRIIEKYFERSSAHYFVETQSVQDIQLNIL